MNTKAVLCVLVVLVLLSTGCAEYANYSTADLTVVAQLPEGPTKDALAATAIARYVAAEMAQGTANAAQGTAQAYQQQQREAEQRAQQERVAMTAEAQREAEARASEAAATRQALSMAATAQALTVEATRAAIDTQATAQAIVIQATETAESRLATATAEARNATATAETRNAQATATAGALNATATREAATATVQAALDNAQATAVQATAASVARQEERERITQPLRTFGPWLLLLLGTIAVSLVGYYGWRLFEDRARLVRRDPDEGEPIMLITRERMALPLRQFGPYADLTHGQENAPLLAPTVEAQESATMRQQTANAIQARQVGKVAQAKSKAPVIVNGQSRRATSRPRSRNRVSVPGLVKVVAVGDLAEATAQGILPPRLAKEIEGQWTEI